VVIYVDPDPNKEPLRICGRLEVAALTRDSKGDGWGRLLRWSDAEGHLHEWAMPMSLLAGDGNEYRARLLDGGLFLAPGRRARELLTVYLQTMRPKARALCVARVGWNEDNFVLPGTTIGPVGAGTILFQTPFETDHLLNVSGTLDEWRENVSQFCSGNSRLILAVSCAFAGPAHALVRAESGGVHFVGPTSTGKSTALVVGGSVVGGGGRNGFVQSWRTTTNGLEAIAELHNDLTLFLDELAQLDPKEAAEIAYLLANGSGKGRMTRNIGARKKLSWSLVFVSAGEITLADHAQTAGKRTKGGAEVRLLNIDADAGAGCGLFENIHGAESPDAFARQLKGAARQYYGTPLRAYLDVLAGNRAAAETALRNFQTDFLSRHVPAGSSGEVFRAAQRFGLIAAAGELATDAGITGWEKDEAITAAANCLESWISSRGTTGALDAESAVKQVRRFLEAHGASRFQPVRHQTAEAGMDSLDENQLVVNRAGFRRKTNDGEMEYLVLPETFKSEVCASFDYRMVVHALEDRGFLERQPPSLTKRVRVPGNVDPIWVFCVKASILEG
jgi:putative DNA primase/helicase